MHVYDDGSVYSSLTSLGDVQGPWAPRRRRYEENDHEETMSRSTDGAKSVSA